MKRDSRRLAGHTIRPVLSKLLCVCARAIGAAGNVLVVVGVLAVGYLAVEFVSCACCRGIPKSLP